jgi:hypothetical protein
MGGFADEAYRRELERLLRARHDGEAPPTRPYDPRPGRRIRSGRVAASMEWGEERRCPCVVR